MTKSRICGLSTTLIPTIWQIIMWQLVFHLWPTKCLSTYTKG